MAQSPQLRPGDYFEALSRHRFLIGLVALGTAALALLITVGQDRTYEATASIQVSSEHAQSPFAVGTEDKDVRTFDLVTEVAILSTPSMRAQVIKSLGPDAEPFGAVKAVAASFNEVIQIRVLGPSPKAAADAANAYADLAVTQRRERSSGALLKQAAELRRQSDAASAQLAELERQPATPSDSAAADKAALSNQIFQYNSRASNLEVEAALREGSTRVVSPATPNSTPVSPRPLRATSVGLVLGLLAGVGIAVLREIQLDRLRSPEELAALDPNVPVLSSIPHLSTRDLPGRSLPPEAVEGYRYLRTSLAFRGVRSIVTTSAMQSEGKSTTAVNLALSMADAGDRVVLIDADLRLPGVHSCLGLNNDLGLTSVLNRQVAVGDVLRFVRPSLVVLTSGPVVRNPPGLLATGAFRQLVEELRSQCDVLIIDAPPVLPVADPLLSARLVDGAVVVARLGGVKRRQVRSALRRLGEAGLPVIGLVANDVESRLGYPAYGASEAPPRETLRRRATDVR